jgi:hypothetical protein
MMAMMMVPRTMTVVRMSRTGRMMYAVRRPWSSLANRGKPKNNDHYGSARTQFILFHFEQPP